MLLDAWCFWTPPFGSSGRLPKRRLPFFVTNPPPQLANAVAHRAFAVPRATRSLRANDLYDDAKRAITAAARPGLDVQV